MGETDRHPPPICESRHFTIHHHLINECRVSRFGGGTRGRQRHAFTAVERAKNEEQCMKSGRSHARCSPRTHSRCPLSTMASWWQLGIFLIGLSVVSGVQIPECCSLISGSCRSVCEQISLVSIALDPQEHQFRLWNLNQYCAKELTNFWQCVNKSLLEIQQGEKWTGRQCCKLPQSQICQHACLKAQYKSDLFQECRRSDEIGFFSCVEQLEVGEKCCANAQTIDCQQACQQVFSSRQTPSRKVRNAVSHSCAYHSPKVIRCVQDYAKITPANNPQRNLHCCDKSLNEECRSACVHALRTKKTDQEIVDAIEVACGAPLPYDKLWQCFLHNADPTKSHVSVSSINRMGMDSAKLHCCSKAVSTTCRKLCFRTFSNDWATNWDAFDRQCQADSRETEMVACLAEVDEPCELGCEGLTYCTNFNDRPTEMFQSCSIRSDRAASKDVELWQRNYITMPSVQIPVTDIMRCDPATWKAVACTLQLKPCRPLRPISTICKSDCTAILTKCLDYERLPEGVTAESLCDILAPTSTTADESCISLATYLVKSPVAMHAAEVTHPCHPNPCNVTELCIVTRSCSAGQVCLPYECVPGCRMGDISSLVVPEGALVSIPLPTISNGCQKVCRCSKHLMIEDCHNGLCIETLQCWDRRKRIDHGKVYEVECNKCVCYNGEITCTHFSCGDSKAFVSYTGLPCNCASHYVPVCGTNGRTYPSACLAKCAGLQERQLDFGACSSINPCSSNPCLLNQKCIPWRAVCLSTNHRSCKQYECVNINSDCEMQSKEPVCDTKFVQHPNLCHLLKNSSILAHRGRCLSRCRRIGIVCGHDGETYSSECAAWANRIFVDYDGPCIAVGAVHLDHNETTNCVGVRCSPLLIENCVQVTPPGACCPVCAGCLQVLFSKKHVDQLLSTIRYLDQMRVAAVAENLRRHVQSAECDLFAYLSIHGSLVVLVAPIMKQPTSLQAAVCVTEAEKLAMLLTRHSSFLATDVLLTHLVTADIIHSHVSAGWSLRCDLEKSTLFVLLLAILTYIMAVKRFV